MLRAISCQHFVQNLSHSKLQCTQNLFLRIEKSVSLEIFLEFIDCTKIQMRKQGGAGEKQLGWGKAENVLFSVQAVLLSHLLDHNHTGCTDVLCDGPEVGRRHHLTLHGESRLAET